MNIASPFLDFQAKTVQVGQMSTFPKAEKKTAKDVKVIKLLKKLRRNVSSNCPFLLLDTFLVVFCSLVVFLSVVLKDLFSALSLPCDKNFLLEPNSLQSIFGEKVTVTAAAAWVFKKLDRLKPWM